MDRLGFVGAHPLLVVVPPAVGLGLLIYKLEERRKARLRAAARELGLVVTDDGLRDVPEGARKLPVFEHGNGHALSCVFWGQDRDYFLAELRYSVGSGKSRTTVTQSVAAFHCPGGGIPLFLEG